MKLGVLQKKATLQLSIILIITISLGGVISLIYLFNLFNKFERNTIYRKLDTASLLINEELNLLKKFSIDYGLWDDTYNYMSNSNSQYIESTYTYQAIKNIGADSVILLDINQRIKFIATLSEFINQSADDIELSVIPEVVDQLIKKIIDKNLLTTKTVFIDFVADQAYAVALSKITKSDGSGEPRGWVIMIRYFNQERLLRLQKLSDSEFNIKPIEFGMDSHINFNQDKFSAEHIVTAENPYSLLLAGQRPLKYQSTKTYQLLILNLVFVWLMSLLFVMFGIKRLVINRLQQYSLTLDLIRANKNTKERLNYDGVDEIDHLAKSFNDLLEEINQQQNQLIYEATHDLLTNLANRNRLNEQIKLSLSLLRRKIQKSFCFLLIDLDGFKQINDIYGHKAGDALLIETAKRISFDIRCTDCAARLGGDEFAILLLGVNDPINANELANRFRKTLAAPISYQNTVLQVSISIGVLFVDQAAAKNLTHDDILKQADIAMYQAKKNGRDQVMMFDKQMELALIEYVRLEKDLRESIAKESLDIYFQPILSSDGQRIESLEVLGRWYHPELGSISPDRFIAIAENAHIISQYTLMMARKACMMALENFHIYQNLRLSINISIQELLEINFFANFYAMLRNTNFPVHLLNLEVTESLLAQNEDELIKPMQQFHDLGITFHIDDFGTGYSSFARLYKLPINLLKIDKSFVQRIGLGGEPIIHAIVEMARSLNLQIIFEGVETQEQLHYIQEIGNCYVQGYIFAKPMNLQDTTNWLHNFIRQFPAIATNN